MFWLLSRSVDAQDCRCMFWLLSRSLATPPVLADPTFGHKVHFWPQSVVDIMTVILASVSVSDMHLGAVVTISNEPPAIPVEAVALSDVGEPFEPVRTISALSHMPCSIRYPHVLPSTTFAVHI